MTDLQHKDVSGETPIVYFGNPSLEAEINSEVLRNDPENNYTCGLSTWREMPVHLIAEILNIPIAEPQGLDENVKNYLDDFVDGSKEFNPDRFANFPKEWFNYIKEATEQQIKVISDTKEVSRKDGNFLISFK